MRRRVLALLAILLLLGRPAAAAVAFDAATSGTSATATSLTYAHTTSGSDRFLVVMVYYNAGAGSISSVTYNGTAMVLADDAAPGTFHGASYYLLNPASGSNNVVVTASASLLIISAAASYTGVKQFDTNGEAHGTSTAPTASLTTIKDNTWTVGAIGDQSGWSAASMTTGTLRTSGGAGVNSIAQIADTNANKTPPGSTTIAFSDATNPLYFIGLISMSSDAAASPVNGRMFLVFP